MDQELYHHFQSIYSKQFNQVIEALKDKLYASIMSLGEDEAIKQLSLDQSLQSFKLDRVKEILQQTFILVPVLEEQTSQIAQIKSENFQLKSELKSKDREQLEELSEVQKKFSQYKARVQTQRNALDALHSKNSQYTQEIGHYKIIIKSMQEDMSRIKSQWQKKCQQVERESYEQSRQLVEEARRDAQAKLDVWLEHMSSQEGALVVREDHKLISQLKQQQSKQIKRIKQTYSTEIQQLQSSLASLRSNQKRLKDELRESANKIQQVRQSQGVKESKYKDENNMLRSQIQLMSNKNQQLVRQRIAGTKKLSNEAEQLKTQLGNTSQLIESKQHQIRILREKLSNFQLSMKELKQTKHRLSVQISEKDSKNIQLESKIIKEKEKDKNIKEKIRRMMHQMEGIRLQSDRLKNQFDMEKNQIKYEFDMFKRRINSFVEEILDYLPIQIQKFEMKYNNKLSSIMNQFQLNQKKDSMALEQVLKDNQYLRMQLKQCQQVFESKLDQIRIQKQQPRIDVQGEIQQLRRTVIKMVRNFCSQKNETYEKIRLEIQERENMYNQLLEERQQLIEKNRQISSRVKTIQNELVQNQRCKKIVQKQLRQVKSQLKSKDILMQQYSKQSKQKENVRSTNQSNQEKQLQEIRKMIIKSYKAVEQAPQKDRRKM